MIRFELKHPQATEEHLGYIPMFLNESNPAAASQQINDAYRHGGGWRNMKGWLMNPSTGSLKFDDDHPLPVLAEARLRNEIIRVYPSGWTAIVQPDGSFEVCRLD